LKRYEIDPVIFERNRVGGLLLNANLVENYPGFPAGIPGTELASLFEEHLARLGVEICHSDVTNLLYEENSVETGGAFLIRTEEESYRPRVVVIATGTRPKRLNGLQIPEEVRERVIDGVYPILGEHGRRMAVVGSGDAAFDYALSLSRRNNQVLLLNRSTRRKCLTLLWREVLQDRRIEYKEETEVTNLDFCKGQLRVQCRKKPDATFSLLVDYLVVAVGRIPDTSCISEELRKGILELQRRQRLHLVGDVKRGAYRQTAIAVGDGVYAAMKIHNMLRGERECG
jgi:thioredoxin reductase